MRTPRMSLRLASVGGAVISSLLTYVCFAPSASARIAPPPFGGDPNSVVPPHRAPAVSHIVFASGVSNWQVALIAVGAALFTAVVVLLVGRTALGQRTVNRRHLNVGV